MDDHSLASQRRPALPAIEPGSVWLVGAGPGDPGLLTLHAANALAHADCVVYDALVSPEILALARPGAALEYAGKRGGKPSASQPDICGRLIRLARQGQRVLRLKGGDPFVFGRGGEEALALAAARVPFRLVPGVTAAAGGLAAAGIPMTHRTTNSAVTLLTGHDTAGRWRAGCAGLAGHRARRAGADLLHGAPPARGHRRTAGRGRPRRRHACGAHQPRHHRGRARGRGSAGARRRQRPSAQDIEAPCLVVVGDVVRLRRALDPAATVEARAEAAEALARALAPRRRLRRKRQDRILLPHRPWQG